MARRSGRDDEDEDDAVLWEEFTRDIKPFVKKSAGSKYAVSPEKQGPPRTAKRQSPAIERPAPKTVPRQPAQLDGSTQSKLQKGKIPVEGRLDLHGYTQAQAQDALEAFVLRAAKAGKRCLLVITGKGLTKNGEGVLRQRLPQWIALSPLSDVVLKAVSAAPKDGGTGAFYLYLKRQR